MHFFRLEGLGLHGWIACSLGRAVVDGDVAADSQQPTLHSGHYFGHPSQILHRGGRLFLHDVFLNSTYLITLFQPQKFEIIHNIPPPSWICQFYHACDSDVYMFCLMRGSVMQFCDFYASIMAFWVTVIALSDLPEYLRSLAHMVGALGIAFGVEYNRTGLWVFIAPFAASIVIMTSSWVRRPSSFWFVMLPLDSPSFTSRIFQIHHCRQQKVCYPEKKRWLLGILPGVILAGSGLILFAFFETKQNYAYVHSAWHVATALSILVLLPFKKNYQGTSHRHQYDLQDLSSSDE